MKNFQAEIIENLKEGILVFDKEKNLIFFNKTAKEIFQIQNEFLGKKISDFLASPYLKYLFYLLGEELKEVRGEIITLNENLIVEVNSFPLLEKNEIFGYLVSILDVTKEKKARDLQSEFISLAALYLRTPLTAIKWALEKFIKAKENELNTSEKGLISLSLLSVQRMINLISDLLYLNKIEEEILDKEKENLNLPALIKEVLSEFKDYLREKNLKVELNFPIQFPKVLANKEHLKLVVKNLIKNAIDYSISNTPITITLSAEKGEVYFQVEDRGIGIPEKEKIHIFQKFFRGNQASKLNPTGSGLSLYICKKIIEAYGGTIWFQSEEKKGSTFFFTLPLK